MNDKNRLAEELARKKQEQMDKTKDQQDPVKLLQEAQARNTYLEAQARLLHEQLLQKKSDDEETKLQQAADQLKKEQAALEEEANLRKSLSQAFPMQKLSDDQDSLKPDQMISIMGDAVGKAIDAQTKLVLSKVSEMMKQNTSSLDSKITGTQEALIKLMAGLSINEAKSQYKDFDEFSPDISKILSSTQGLSPEDAYLLAKSRKASQTPSQRQVETERPNEGIQPLSRRETSSREESDQDQPKASAKSIFQEATRKAIDKILAARQK